MKVGASGLYVLKSVLFYFLYSTTGRIYMDFDIKELEWTQF